MVNEFAFAPSFYTQSSLGKSIHGNKGYHLISACKPSNDIREFDRPVSVAAVLKRIRFVKLRLNATLSDWEGIRGDRLRSVRLKSYFFRRPALGNIFVRNFTFIPLFGNIEIAVTATEFLDVRHAVNARANDIPVGIPVSGEQPAGTPHIAITFFIGN